MKTLLTQSKWVLVMILWLMPGRLLMAGAMELFPVKDTCVLNPGIGNKFINGANMNFGGAGSRSVSAEQARAYSPSEGIAQKPKGEFRSLLQFDFSDLAGQTIDQIGLNLYISNGNEGAGGIYNVRGHSGTVGVYLIQSDWEQGYNTPNLTTPVSGITHNALESLLQTSPAVLINQFYYDGANPYGSPAWYRFALSTGTPAFSQALTSGGAFTLMLSALDEEVCFNFTAYLQNSQVNPVYRETGPYLDVAFVPEPGSLAILMTASALYARMRTRQNRCCRT